MDPFIGYALLDRYLLLERVGQGGFATVYRAEKMGSGTHVAVKLVTQARRGDETIARRFEREGQILNAFSHPNAVGMVECGVTEEGLGYIVMEFVAGETLRHVIANESPLALPRVEAVLLQVGAAITAAHAHGIVHRDLKPENVMIVQTPMGEVPKVLDFGVASLRTAEGADGRITAKDLIVGTPRYLAPEALIEGVQTAASDVYSLGIIAYEMLTGRVPFEPTIGENSVEVAIRLAKQRPPAPSGFNEQLSEEIDAVILRCLSRDPAERFATPTDFAEAVALAVENVLANSPSTDPLSRAMPALRPDQFDAFDATIKGVPAILDEPAPSRPAPAPATVVGMPALPGSAPLTGDSSEASSAVLMMPALPSSKLPPAAPATVVGRPARPSTAPGHNVPDSAATIVGMPALPSAPLRNDVPDVSATVVGMPALPSAPLRPDVPDAAATVVGMPALPSAPLRPDVPDAAAPVVGMPALPSAPLRPNAPDAAATVVGMPVLQPNAGAQGGIASAAATVVGMPVLNQSASVTPQPAAVVEPPAARSLNLIVIVVAFIALLVIVAAIFLFR